jgi:hypothetical protein
MCDIVNLSIYFPRLMSSRGMFIMEIVTRSVVVLRTIVCVRGMVWPSNILHDEKLERRWVDRLR